MALIKIYMYLFKYGKYHKIGYVKFATNIFTEKKFQKGNNNNNKNK